MKKLLLIMTLLVTFTSLSQSGLRVPKEEYFIGRASIMYYPKETSRYNNGTDFMIEAGYQGFVYAIVGVERFSRMKSEYEPTFELDTKGNLTEVYSERKFLKGYTSLHGVVGFNLTSGYWENVNYHFGMRFVRAWRGDISQGYWRVFFGAELGINFEVNDVLSLGVKGTIDKKRDMELFYKRAENVFSPYITITYKFKRLHG